MKNKILLKINDIWYNVIPGLHPNNIIKRKRSFDGDISDYYKIIAANGDSVILLKENDNLKLLSARIAGDRISILITVDHTGIPIGIQCLLDNKDELEKIFPDLDDVILYDEIRS